MMGHDIVRFALLIAGLHLYLCGTKAGIVTSTTLRIVGGNKAELNEFPWMALGRNSIHFKIS